MSDKPPSTSAASAEPSAPGSSSKPQPVMAAPQVPLSAGATQTPTDNGLFGRLKRLFGGSDPDDSPINGTAVYGDAKANGNGAELSEADRNAASHERMLIENVLELRNTAVADCMIPRVDIAAIDVETPHEDIMGMLENKTHSRIPVYRENLDEVVGVLHVRDVLAALAAGKSLVLTELVREPMIVAPSMPVMDLLLEMRLKQSHLALVVDEFGGIDGLISIEDLVEQIVGEIRDEHETEEAPQLVPVADGTLAVDARLGIEEFEDYLGPVLTEDEREDIDTLGGLVFALAGEVPNRGALLTHSSGLEFEVLECDPRRIRRLRVRNLQARDTTITGVTGVTAAPVITTVTDPTTATSKTD